MEVLQDVVAGTRSLIQATGGTAIIAKMAPLPVLLTVLCPTFLLYGVAFAYGRLVRRLALKRQAALAVHL